MVVGADIPGLGRCCFHCMGRVEVETAITKPTTDSDTSLPSTTTHDHPWPFGDGASTVFDKLSRRSLT